MFPQATPAEPARTTLPPAAPVSNWSVALYRKAEPILPSTNPDVPQAANTPPTLGSFYVQLQQQASAASPSRSDALYFRYQAQQQRNSVNAYALPFTISQVTDAKLASDSAPLATTSRHPNSEPHAGKTELLSCLTGRRIEVHVHVVASVTCNSTCVSSIKRSMFILLLVATSRRRRTRRALVIV